MGKHSPANRKQRKGFNLTRFLCPLPCILLFCNVAIAAPSFDRNHTFINEVRVDQVKTIQIYNGRNPNPRMIEPESIPRNQSNTWILKFDDLYNDYMEDYRFKIIHCNADWKASGIQDFDYLFEYNEFAYLEAFFSINTLTPFTHYTYRLPRLKLSGNYAIVMYNIADDNVLFTRRIIVYDQIISVGAAMEQSFGIAESRTSHQIRFEVNYKNYEILNPPQDIKVVLRQNGRWDNYLIDLQPTNIRLDAKVVKYELFDLSNNFKAGNEHRFFDIRSRNFSGRNVASLKNEKGLIHAYLYYDKSRGAEAYSIYEDLNGGYYVENTETGDPFIEADYFMTHFFLKSESPFPGDVYVTGKLTDYQYNASTQMRYDQVNGVYFGTLLLKQGLYDYQYIIPERKKSNQIEGDHFQTTNLYEVLVYVYNPVARCDLLIGYALIK